MENFISTVNSVNWPMVGTVFVVLVLACFRFFQGVWRGIALARLAPKPVMAEPVACEPSPLYPKLQRLRDQSERIDRNIKEVMEGVDDIKSDTRQLGRDSGRDHAMLVEIKDGIETLHRQIAALESKMITPAEP